MALKVGKLWAGLLKTTHKQKINHYKGVNFKLQTIQCRFMLIPLQLTSVTCTELGSTPFPYRVLIWPYFVHHKTSLWPYDLTFKEILKKHIVSAFNTFVSHFIFQSCEFPLFSFVTIAIDMLPPPDINECGLNPDVCLHGTCQNRIGSYECLCFPGYKLSVDSKYCVGENFFLNSNHSGCDGIKILGQGKGLPWPPCVGV